MEVFFYALPAQLYLEIITEKEFVGFVNSSEVILRLPEATLQGYRGKSGGRLDAFHPPFPSPAVLEAQRTPPGEWPPEVKNH